MEITAAVSFLLALLQQLAEASSSAQGAQGERLVALLNAVSDLSNRAMSAFTLIRAALEQGRKELTDDEVQQLRDLDDAARGVLVGALGTESTRARDTESESSRSKSESKGERSAAKHSSKQ